MEYNIALSDLLSGNVEQSKKNLMRFESFGLLFGG